MKQTMNNIKVGIKERIEAATSIKEVEMLLQAVKSFTYASAKTLRRCQKVAKARITYLEKV